MARLSGFPEFLPAERNVELAVLDHLRRVFEDLPAVVRLSPELFDRAEPGLARMHYDLSMNV